MLLVLVTSTTISWQLLNLYTSSAIRLQISKQSADRAGFLKQIGNKSHFHDKIVDKLVKLLFLICDKKNAILACEESEDSSDYIKFIPSVTF